MDDKIKNSLSAIEDSLSRSSKPIVMCSFGKDSLAMLHLIRTIKKTPVLFFKEAFFAKKNRFANELSEEWDLDVYDFPPFAVRTIQDNDNFEVVNLYKIGPREFIFLPTGVSPPREGERFLCAKEDFIEKPKASMVDFPWDLVFIGHKSSDVNPFVGRTKIINYESNVGDKVFCYPIKDWTDQDIWDYIRDNDIPYNDKRYQENNSEFSDLSFNADYFPTCFKCLDYKESQMVMCPKSNSMIMNSSMSKEMNEIDLRTYKGVFNNIEMGVGRGN